MRILVIGAAGRTGRHFVEQALGHGHEVRAMVHAAPLALAHPRLEIVSGDVLDFESVKRAMEGVDGVAFVLGGGASKSVRVYSEGIANVIHAMAVHEVTALVAVTAAGVFARNDKHLSLGFKALIRTAYRSTYDDMERMEQRIAASDLDWTIVRPVGLSDGPLTGRYRVSLDGSLLPKASRISRADVAAMMLKALETGAFDRKTLVIAD
jgi:putative NADH-flavin reductase